MSVGAALLGQSEVQYAGLNEAATEGERQWHIMLDWTCPSKKRRFVLWMTRACVVARTDVSTDPDLIARFISKHAPNVERVVHESGILAIWLTRELEKAWRADHLHRCTSGPQSVVGAD